MRSSSRRAIALLLGCAGILLAILWLRAATTQSRRQHSEDVAPAGLPTNERSGISSADLTETRVSLGPSTPGASTSTPARLDETRKTGSFVATFLEEDGTPIRSDSAAWLDLTNAAGQRRMAGHEDRGMSERFALRDLPLGTYSATAYVYLHRMAVELEELTASRPDVVKEFRLPRLPALAVTVVTPDGRPFRSACRELGAPEFLLQILPVATRDSPGPRFDAMRGSGADPVGIGEFWEAASDRPATEMGTLLLHADPPVYVSLILGTAVLQTKRVERGTSEVKFELSVQDATAALSSLHVHVRDEATALPVDDALVALRCGESQTLGARTNTSGEVTLEPVLPGLSIFLCTKSEYATSRMDLEIAPGQAADLDVRLARPLDVEVHVFSPEGRPCSASFRVMRSVDDSKRRFEAIRTITSTTDGNLVVPDLEHGTYLLGDAQGSLRDSSRFREDSTELVTANVVIDTTSGVPAPIDVRLSKAVTLWIRSPPGDPVDLEFEVTDARDLPVCSDRFDLPWPRCARLAPGTYRVRFKDSGGKILEEKEVVLVASPVDLTFGG